MWFGKTVEFQWFRAFSATQRFGSALAQCRVLDSRPRGGGFEPQRRHCVVSLSKTYNPSLIRVHSRKTRSYITERLLMGRKESTQTNKYTAFYTSNRGFVVTTFLYYSK